MIRVAIVDDHPAIRMGLASALGSEPDLVPVGSATQPEELPPLLYRTRPDVVVLDYHLPRRDGLSICRQIKAEVPAPAVLLYSAYADASLVVPAIIAGAGGIVHKNAAPRDLFQAIRVVAQGGTALPPIPADLLELAGDALDPEDLPILGMLINRTPHSDIAAALRLSSQALAHRITEMLNRLKTPVVPTTT